MVVLGVVRARAKGFVWLLFGGVDVRLWLIRMVGCRAGRPGTKNGGSDRKISSRPRRLLGNSGAEILGMDVLISVMIDVAVCVWRNG